MEMPQRQLMEPREAVEDSPVRRPRFPKKLLDREENFVDPLKEAQFLVPEQTVATGAIVLEMAAVRQQTETAQRRNAFASSLYERILSILAWVAKNLKGKRKRAKLRLTKRGQEALDQLKYLSQLCDATSCRTPDEILAAEGAFGEAYYEIMNLSVNLEKMAQKEEHHHLKRYSRNMGKILGAAD